MQKEINLRNNVKNLIQQIIDVGIGKSKNNSRILHYMKIMYFVIHPVIQRNVPPVQQQLKWSWAASRAVIDGFPAFSRPCNNFLQEVGDISDKTEASFKRLKKRASRKPGLGKRQKKLISKEEYEKHSILLPGGATRSGIVCRN